MLVVKFFQVNGNYYAKQRHDGILVETTSFTNVCWQIGEYIKNLMNSGYARNEITFVIDPTCEEYESEEINRAIEIYAN